MKCPRCATEVVERYACTNCGQVIGQKCLLPRCNGINPLGAKFCGDCGFPMSHSPRQWLRDLGIYQHTMRHPRRNLIFFTTLAAATMAFLLPVVIGGTESPVHLHFWVGAWLWLAVAPLVATLAILVVHPARKAIHAILIAIPIGVIGEYLGFAILSVLQNKASTLLGLR